MSETDKDADAAYKELVGISKVAGKNERLSWRRKNNKMIALLEDLHPIEEEILQLILKKQPVADKVEEVRQQMVKECVHPLDFLVHKGDYVLCKFCGNKIQPLNV